MFTAAILAGGRATRLGGACKPLLRIGGRAILDRQLDVLRPLAGEILLVANDPAPFTNYALRIIPDLRKEQGPLAGLEAALAVAAHDQVLLLAGDLPFLDARALALVASADPAADAAVPFTARGPEPLHARYARRIRPRVAAALDAGRLALHALVDELTVARIEEPALRAIDPTLAFLTNVNTPEDLIAK